jgi:hypothetical protein
VKSITIVADDKVGLLADISYVLAKSKINIESVNVEVVAGKAIIAIGIHDPAKAKAVVEAAGYKCEDPSSIVIKLDDRPGEMERVKEMLAKEGVKIQELRTLSKNGTAMVLSLTVDKAKRASTVLAQHLLTNEPAY